MTGVLRWLFLMLIAACPSTSPPQPMTVLDQRCAEDCAWRAASFDETTFEVAITGEDSWRCFCWKGSSRIQVW